MLLRAKTTMPDKSQEFSIKPLGGLGEVGMNCMLYRFGRKTIPIDCGVLFADTNNFGIEALFPDFREFLKTEPEAWLITHAHEDHIGAIPHLFTLVDYLKVKAPTFYAPPFAAALIREKMMDDRYPDLRHHLDKVKSVELNSTLEIGDISVTFVEVRHSTPDSCALSFLWKTDGKDLKIFHSADFKIDLNEFEDGVKPLSIFKTFGEERPDFLMMDSTNADREGQSVSERDIIPFLKNVLENRKNRIFVTLFSSNVYRIASLIQVAESLGRKVAVAGRSLQTAHRLSMDLNLYEKMPHFHDSTLVDVEMINHYPKDKQLIICSGSQGEIRSVLSRIADDSHQSLKIDEGDLVLFSSKVIPGNERMIQRLVNDLMRQGAKVLWADHAKTAAGGPIHASGHARRAELRTLVDLLKPRNFIPIHGQVYQMSFCAELASTCASHWPDMKMNLFTLENCDEIDFSYRDGEWKKNQFYPLKEEHPPKMLRFENFIAPSRDPFLWQRKQMANNGMIAVSVDGIASIRVSVHGVFPEYMAGRAPYDDLKNDVESFIRQKIKTEKGLSLSDPQSESYLSEELSRFIRRSLNMRPFCVVHLVSSR